MHATATDINYQLFLLAADVANSAFLGLLLLLASGFCITRTDMGEHKTKVIGIPAVIFITSVITDFIYFYFHDDDTANDEVAFDRMMPWERALWFVCTLVNIAALMLCLVYIFDILQQESDAIEEQEAANARHVQPTDVAEQATHAAAPADLDPNLVEEGYVAYKNLLGPNQNISHISGADVEAHEFQTVADRLNFEVKRTLFLRFKIMVLVYLMATLCVYLLPVFINTVVQSVIVFLHFVVQLLFLAGLVWAFRPREDSPYLLIGTSMEDAEAMGITDLDTELAMQENTGEEDGYGSSNGQHSAARAGVNGTSGRDGVELQSGGLGRGKQQGGSSPAVGGNGDLRHQLDQRGQQAGQSGVAGVSLPVSRSAAELPVSPPPANLTIRTSAPVAHESPKFSLDDDEDLHEIRLGSKSPQHR
eukprot:jgi/Chrzof1/1953/Cz10g27200.t1